ncbi:hypothetical protein C0992_011640, partial [Termitomyces sp. T32_za158]
STLSRKDRTLPNAFCSKPSRSCGRKSLFSERLPMRYLLETLRTTSTYRCPRR